MNKQYVITSIADIAKIPEDRLPAFYADLTDAYQNNGLHRTFVWIDDGIIGETTDRYMELGIIK